jgi:molybdopterin-guanine dinucleotide biosynthesis protein A
LAAVYRVEILDSVTQLLSENRLRPVFLFETASTRIVEARELIDVDSDLKSLRNLNTVAEYEAALKEWEEEKREN